MAWPTDDLSTTHLDSDGASPLLARPQLLAAINKIKAMLGFVPAKAGPLGESGINGAAAAGAVTSSGLTMGAGKLLGRATTGSGAPEEISVGAGLELAGGSLECTVAAPVSSVFGRTGAVTLGAGDVVGALGFTPASGAGVAVYPASGIFVVPPGVHSVRVQVQGGRGGALFYSTWTDYGSVGGTIPGGSPGVVTGACAVTPGTSVAVTVGAAGVDSGGAATAGGTSSFMSISATGGGPGGQGSSAGAGAGGFLISPFYDAAGGSVIIEW